MRPQRNKIFGKDAPSLSFQGEDCTPSVIHRHSVPRSAQFVEERHNTFQFFFRCKGYADISLALVGARHLHLGLEEVGKPVAKRDELLGQCLFTVFETLSAADRS